MSQPYFNWLPLNTSKTNTNLPFPNYFSVLMCTCISTFDWSVILSPITSLTHRDLVATLKFCFFWHTRDDVQFGTFAIWPCHHNNISLLGFNIIPYLLLHLNIKTLLLYRRYDTGVGSSSWNMFVIATSLMAHRMGFSPSSILPLGKPHVVPSWPWTRRTCIHTCLCECVNRNGPLNFIQVYMICGNNVTLHGLFGK